MTDQTQSKILWITHAEAFLSVDLEIITRLIKRYSIEWYVIKKSINKIDYQEKIEALRNASSLNIQYVIIGQSERSFQTVKSYLRMFRKIKAIKHDVLYTCLSSSPIFMMLLTMVSNKQRTVLGIHNVHVPDGGSRPIYNKINTQIAIRVFKNFQTFSKSQYTLLKQITNNKKRIMMAPLTQPDFGKPIARSEHKIITFLSFGYIRTYKRIDVLIDASERAFNIVQKPFRVIIAGDCENFQPYKDRIIHSELFDLKIGRVDSEDIPVLFEQADYYVAAYQDIAQSASIIVAINYLKPVIASRLPAFEEYIDDGKNGYLITPASVDELTNIIVQILNDNSNYSLLTENLKDTVMKKTSPIAISERYISFFEEIIGEQKHNGEKDSAFRDK